MDNLDLWGEVRSILAKPYAELYGGGERASSYHTSERDCQLSTLRCHALADILVEVSVEERQVCFGYLKSHPVDISTLTHLVATHPKNVLITSSIFPWEETPEGAYADLGEYSLLRSPDKYLLQKGSYSTTQTHSRDRLVGSYRSFRALMSAGMRKGVPEVLHLQAWLQKGQAPGTWGLFPPEVLEPITNWQQIVSASRSTGQITTSERFYLAEGYLPLYCEDYGRPRHLYGPTFSLRLPSTAKSVRLWECIKERLVSLWLEREGLDKIGSLSRNKR